MYKLVFYVPKENTEEVKSAVFATGAGKIGNYDSCCWQVLGKGQFRPLKGSQPAIGQEDQIEYVEEFRVELVCENHLIQEAVNALKIAHPYEEPAYDVWQLLDL
jgi:hypothetical protein